MSIRREYYTGPLPHPELMKGYDEILPGAADRILQSFEHEGTHRREIEANESKARIEISKRGQILALIVSIFFGSGSFAVVLAGHDSAGAVIATGVIVGLAVVFVAGRSETGEIRSSELESEKSLESEE